LLGNEKLTREELQLIRNKAKNLMDEIFGTSFFVVLEFHTTEGNNIFEELIYRPKYTYERIVAFFKNVYTIDSIIQIMDNKMYEKHGISGLILDLVSVARNDDKDGVARAIKALLNYTR